MMNPIWMRNGPCYLLRLGTWLVLVILTGLSFASLARVQACEPSDCSETPEEPTELVVKLHDGVKIDVINGSYQTQVVDALPSLNIYVLESTDGSSVWSLVDEIEDLTDLVIYAEVNYPVQAPEGQPYSLWGHPYSLWGHPDAEPPVTIAEAYLIQPALEQIRQPTTAGGDWAEDVVIAVLDTGVDFEHPALAGRLTAEGYDFVDDDSDPSDVSNEVDDDQDGLVDEMAGHGTFVAGLAGLIAPEARIMPLRVLDSDGLGRAFVLAEAIDHAVQHGADVINLSLRTTAYSLALEQALENANASGVVVVAAAGNNNAEVQLYPASGYKVVSVTATDPESHKASFANYGSLVDLAAPGVDLLGPANGGYAVWSGTSMAAPLVAGEAALLMGLTPGQDNADDVIVCLEKDAVKVDEGHPVHGGKLGKGQIDVTAAFACYQSYAESH
jgi:subtilisin family serine protease